MEEMSEGLVDKEAKLGIHWLYAQDSPEMEWKGRVQ
jgi:hypothetical protein